MLIYYLSLFKAHLIFVYTCFVDLNPSIDPKLQVPRVSMFLAERLLIETAVVLICRYHGTAHFDHVSSMASRQ